MNKFYLNIFNIKKRLPVIPAVSFLFNLSDDQINRKVDSVQVAEPFSTHFLVSATSIALHS